MKRLGRLSSGLYVFLCFTFFYAPIVVTMVYSFNSSRSLAKFTGFSLQWYEALINNSEIMSAVWVSVSVALIATAISTVLGTITAIGLSKSRKILKEWILNINNIPIMNPEIVTAIGLMIFFAALKIEKGYLTLLLAHISFCTPYVITSVYPKVRELDPNIANAAMDLGATPFQALVKVIVPMIKPGITAGMLLAFTMSFDDFVISYFVSGNGVMNISTIVYNMTKRTNPTINALSTLVILAIVILIAIGNIVPRLKKNKFTSRTKVILSLAGVALCTMLFVMSGKGGQTLKIYNAGEYIDTELIDVFEKENGCTVIYETFDSNESMYTKVMSGEEYDIIIPSDYMIERLIIEDSLQEIDKSQLSNYNQLIPALLDREFDPGSKYHVPYFWGNVGILYDKTVVDENDLKAGWEILKNPKYRGNVYMYDSERDSFMIALKALGYSLNTTDFSELDEAYKWLVEQREIMAPVYIGDEVIDSMITGSKAMAIVYSGDAAYIMSENENLGFFAPDKGTNLWIDGMVITKDCDDVSLAHSFIDFMLDPDNAYANSMAVGYSSPIKSAFSILSETDYAGIEAYIPRQDNKNDEFFRYQEPEVKEYSAELWTKVKAQKE